jgi:Family of unknown function (DUF6311)
MPDANQSSKIRTNWAFKSAVGAFSKLKFQLTPSGFGGLTLSVLFSLIYFFSQYPRRFISGTSSYWQAQDQDIAQYIAGFRAFVHEPWQWPLLKISSLNWPEGTLATFVDAIPLYAVILKIGLHGNVSTYNPYGMWVFICYVLQAVGAWWILREVKNQSWVALTTLTALLLTYPALNFRLGHISLMSHWLILFSYAIYLKGNRSETLAIVPWAALIFCSFYINIYLFAMVSIVFFADILRFRNTQGNTQSLKALALPYLIVGLSLFVTMLPLPKGAGANETGFGHYSMNILSPFAGGRFLQLSNPIAHSEQGEGFNYIGIAIVAAGVYAWTLRSRYDANFFRRHRFLIGGLVAASIYALSNRVFLGPLLLFQWYEPEFFKLVTGQFRASGRFFWLVGYGILIFCIVSSVRFVNPRRLIILLVAIVAFQWWDLTDQRAQLRVTASRPVHAQLNYAVWNQFLGKPIQTLHFYPSFRCGKTSLNGGLLPTMRYAADNGLNLSTGYIARASKPCEAISEQISRTDRHSSAYVFERNEFSGIAQIYALFGEDQNISCSVMDFAYVCKLSP